MGGGGSLGPGFRALYRGSLVSNTGDGIRLAALPLLAASLTTSPFLIASVTAAQYLAWLAFGPFGGAIVDRAERRRAILTTQLWRGLLMAGLGLRSAPPHRRSRRLPRSDAIPCSPRSLRHRSCTTSASRPATACSWCSSPTSSTGRPSRSVSCPPSVPAAPSSDRSPAPASPRCSGRGRRSPAASRSRASQEALLEGAGMRGQLVEHDTGLEGARADGIDRRLGPARGRDHR